jgi:hypothetical protein
VGVWRGPARGQAITPGDSPGRPVAYGTDPLCRNNDLWLNPAPKPLILTMNDPYRSPNVPKCSE